MASAPGRLRHWWDRVRAKDPYWDAFLHRPPSDPRNVITPVILSAPTGSVFPQQTDVHDRTAMSGHIKELAKFFGADATGVSAVVAGAAVLVCATTEPGEEQGEGGQGYPFAISCLVEAVEDVPNPVGIGGQFALQRCAVVNFNIAAYIRELGYRATVSTEEGEAYAAAAALGSLDREGRLVSSEFGRRAGIAGVVFTDLPLTPDKPAA